MESCGNGVSSTPPDGLPLTLGSQNFASEVCGFFAADVLSPGRAKPDDRIERGGVPAPVIGQNGSIRPAKHVP